jgi:hypothetical protein
MQEKISLQISLYGCLILGAIAENLIIKLTFLLLAIIYLIMYSYKKHKK